MADKTMLNFRCPGELLDAIDALGQERYPSETAKHGCDRSKTLLDIVRAGIEALSDGSIVLPLSQASVRHCKTEDVIDIESRFAALEERLGKIEGLSDFPELLKPDAELTDSELNIHLEDLKSQVESSRALTDKILQQDAELRSQLEAERASRQKIEAELSELKQNSAPVATRSEKLTADPATILSQLRARRKKSKTDLQDLEAILEILES